MKPVVAIAISGGIDSLMAAYLLKKGGFNVFGIHFITGFEDHSDLKVTQPETVGARLKSDSIKFHAAQKIAHIESQLDINVKLIDCRKEFKRTVVDYFTQTYQNGQTPNPCMVCNPAIKFGTVLDFACQQGASHLATGHYARLQKDNQGRFHLIRGVDAAKEQSYFLALMNQQQLAKACFPLGEMTKSEVIELAAAKALTPALIKESQDICFIKNKSYAEFLKSQKGFEPQPGTITDVHGNILGQHKGLHLYTVGQRRGINCPASEPYYVIGLDTKHNRLIVGFKKDLLASKFNAVYINWINQRPAEPIYVHARLRYRHKAAAARLVPLDAHTATICFETPQTAITPGQCAVFYQGNEVLGGGWIRSES